MLPTLPPSFSLHPAVARALREGQPVVALESALITHGLPHPENLDAARRMEALVRAEGATPATVAVLDGRVHIGLDDADLARLADQPAARKIGRRDLAAAIAAGASGGTTVSATLAAAARAGLRVFATGGIGGVHRGDAHDVSADLPALAETPMLVVCAGAKAILDLPATLEALETLGVPVVGFGTDEFPAFYSAGSGLPVSARVDAPEEAARLAREHWALGLESALLVAVPPPPQAALPRESVAVIIAQALEEAGQEGIHGPLVTPYLLRRVNELSAGAALSANLALLENNARLAAQIAQALVPAGGLPAA